MTQVAEILKSLEAKEARRENEYLHPKPSLPPKKNVKDKENANANGIADEQLSVFYTDYSFGYQDAYTPSEEPSEEDVHERWCPSPPTPNGYGTVDPNFDDPTAPVVFRTNDDWYFRMHLHCLRKSW